jgi:hypothetical protein
LYLYELVQVIATTSGTPSAAGAGGGGAPPLLAAVGAGMSAIAAVTSSTAAVIALRSQGRWHSSDALIRVSTQFEVAEFRRYRTIVYDLDRSTYASWPDEQKNAVNAWCAHLDLIAVLVQSGHIDEIALLNIYGDVVLRSIYQVAPYCNYQASFRGPQFLLPLRMQTTALVKTWRKQAKRKRYPITIGFPAQPQVRVNPDLFDSDSDVLKFRVDSKLP